MLSLLLLLSANDAHAQQGRRRGPSMYGIGGAVSTTIFPARYPGSFPNAVETSGTWDFTKERLDGGIAAHGVAHVSNQVRLGARVGYRGGVGWSDRYLTLEYDQMGRGDGGFYPYMGLGAGLGNLRFNDIDNDELDLSNFIVKVQAGAIYLDRTRCYEVALSAWYPIPLEHQLGAETVNSRGSRYGAIGVEAGVMFGDFKPHRKKGKKGKKGKNSHR